MAGFLDRVLAADKAAGKPGRRRRSLLEETLAADEAAGPSFVERYDQSQRGAGPVTDIELLSQAPSPPAPGASKMEILQYELDRKKWDRQRGADRQERDRIGQDTALDELTGPVNRAEATMLDAEYGRLGPSPGPLTAERWDESESRDRAELNALRSDDDSWWSTMRKAVQNLDDQIVGRGGGGIIEALPTTLRYLQAAGNAGALIQPQQGWEGAIEEAGKGIFDRASAEIERNSPELDGSPGKQFAYDLVNAFSSLATAVGVSAATRNPNAGVGVLSAMTFGDRFGQSISEGRSREAALVDASIFGFAEAVGESRVIGDLIKPGQRLATRIGKGAVGEAIQEAVTSTIQNGYAAGLIYPDMTVGEVVNAIAYDAALGGGAGAGAAVLSHPFVRRQPGAVEEAETSRIDLSEDDIASPLPTELIAAGRSAIATAEASSQASELLAGAGLPGVNQRVVINRGGRAELGTVEDAFTVSDPSLGENSGVRIRLDTGGSFEEFFDTLRESGVSIKPFQEALEELSTPATEIRETDRNYSNPIPEGEARQRGEDLLTRMIPITLGAEGGGTLANPKTSPKGARGPMQVMPGTDTDPGFGVTPMRENTEAERARVGRDYLAAMLRRYGDPAKAWAAYNAGPGALDNAIAKHGDAWLAHMPAETQDYVRKNVAALGGAAGGAGATGYDGPLGTETGVDDLVTKDSPREDDGAFLEGDVRRTEFTRPEEGRRLEDLLAAEEPVGDGSRQAPVHVRTPDDLMRATERVNTEPTEAQAEAGNYKKLHLKLQGLDITVENPKGSERSGTDPDGKRWSVTMPSHYGYVKRTLGADSEQVDVYVGDHPESDHVFVIDQVDAKTKAFDEHKAVLGAQSEQEAVHLIYDRGFSDGRGLDRVGGVKTMSIDEFKEWLASEQTEPAAASKMDQLRTKMVLKAAPPEGAIISAASNEAGKINTGEPRKSLPTETASEIPELTPQVNSAPDLAGLWSKIEAGSITAKEIEDSGLPTWAVEQAISARVSGEVDSVDDFRAFIKQRATKTLRTLGIEQEAAAEAGSAPDQPVVDNRIGEQITGDQRSALVALRDAAAKGSADRANADAILRRGALSSKPNIARVEGGVVDRAVAAASAATAPTWSLELTPSGKGIALTGATRDQVAAIKQVTGAVGAPRRDGAVVFSKKHEARIRAVLVPDAAATDLSEDKGWDFPPYVEAPAGEEYSAYRLAIDLYRKGFRSSGFTEDYQASFGQQIGSPDWKRSGNWMTPGKVHILITKTKGNYTFSEKDIARDAKLQDQVEDPALTGPETEALRAAAKQWHRTSPAGIRAKAILDRGRTEGKEDEDILDSAQRLFDRERASAPGDVDIEINSTDKGSSSGAADRGQGAGSSPLSTDQPGAAGAATEAQSRAGVSPNRIFTDEAADKARALLRERLKGAQLNAGLDPEIMQAGITLAGYHIEKGARTFAAYAEAMIADLGDVVRPYLRAWYEAIRHHPGMESVAADMSGPEAIGAALSDLERNAKSGTRSDDASASTEDSPRGDDRAGDEGPGPGDLREPSTERPAPGSRRAEGGPGRGNLQPGDEPASRGDVGGEQSAGPDAGDRPDQVGRGGKRDRGGNRVRPKRSGRGYNFLAVPGDLKREGGWKATAERNLDIIDLVNRIEAEGRPANLVEQAQLVKFTGWGAGEIRNNLFRSIVRDPATGERSISPHAWGEWKELIERAAKLLKGEQLELALQSTQYAHYTSEPVIRSMWNALARLGFKGGRILEPGMGIGLFPVAAPADVMKASSYTGIELDPFSAKVAGLLLPQESVLNADYVKQKLPDGFFDLAIGNPPFANTKVLEDPAYKKHRLSLHDYFFAKSIDKVRPGGLMVFVTSRYTMDKAGDRGRQYIAERADLLGAIRLPQTAFKENAGTEVVTDVLFFQRRMPGAEPGGEAWLGLDAVKAGDESPLINEYFARHPEMVLGRHAMAGSMYRDKEYTVVPPDGGDIAGHFANAINGLPENVYVEPVGAGVEAAKARTWEADMRPASEKEGGLYVTDGKVYVRENGVGKPVSALDKVSAADEAWLRDYAGLRDALKQAQRDQLGDGDWEASLKALNRAYDRFTAKHGPISAFTEYERSTETEDGEKVTTVYRRFKNERLLRLDVESLLVEQLEKIGDDGKITKSAFLTGRTLNKPQRPRIETVQDAMAVGLDELGRLDLDYVAGLAGKSREETIEALGDGVYQAPDGTWQTADEYLSGDVLTKLEEAKAAAQADPAYERNVEALIKVQPKPLGPQDISVKLGAGWIPVDIIQAFADKVVGIDASTLVYEPATAEWAMDRRGTRSARSAAEEFGTADRSPPEILLSVLNNQTIKVVRRDSDGRTWTDQEATAAANEAAKKLSDRFKTWVWEDGRRAGELLDIYNSRFNNLAPRRFDGTHLTLPGLSARYNLYPHQKRAVWRIIQTGNTYLAHAVGAGKTLEMIVSGMEQKRLGLIRKPLYAVPNHMLNQFAREFMEAYPAANIMVADEKAFHTDNRRRFMAQAALNDPDAIIVTHSAFGKLSTKPESRKAIVDAMILELEAAMEGSETRYTRAKIEKQIEALRRNFEARTGAGKDQVLTFEELGVDMVYVDEAHEFRKLDFATNRSVKGIDPKGSQRSLDLYIKTRWLDQQRPGRSLVLASGTPVTNTMAEIYTVMRFMDERGLEADGLRAFDAWANMFGEVAQGYEQNAAGGYELVERFARFVNVPELMKRVRTFMDVLTNDSLGDLVKRPRIVGGVPASIISPPIPALKAYMKGELAARIKTSRAWKPSKDQPSNPDPIIAINTDARLASIDMRFIEPGSPNDPGSKLNQMIDKIIARHAAFKDMAFTDPRTGRKEPLKGATQIVFSAVGFGEGAMINRGFDLRSWFDGRLMKEAGLKKAEIAWISDANTHAKREAVFKAMRAGKVKILVGSPKNMGTGVNVQNRLRALHFLAPPWYPADVEQPHGRIVRQGNWNEEVELYWYATKGTYDSTAWGMVSRKARFIEQAMSGDDSVRVLDDISEANQYEMAAALAAGDERIIQVAGLSSEIERLSRLQGAHHDEQRQLSYDQRWKQKDVEAAKAAIAAHEKAMKARDPAAKFEVEVGGARYDEHKKAGEALIAAMGNKLGRKTVPTVTLGTYQGHRLVMRPSERLGSDLAVSVEVGGTMFDAVRMEQELVAGADPTGLASRIANAVARIPGELRGWQDTLAAAELELRKIDRKLGAPFPQEQELAEKVAERAQLQAQLAAETAAADQAEAGAKPRLSAVTGSAARRSFGIPEEAGDPLAAFRNTKAIKAHPDYEAAKAGDNAAALRLVRDLVPASMLEEAAKRWPGATFVPALAIEASGRNKIPVMLAAVLADRAGGDFVTDIIQANRAFHTGAGAMERLLARPLFDGPVESSRTYVIVDDVSVMGGTLAEIANHIRAGGGNVAGTALLVNGSRSKTLAPNRRLAELVERRFGDVLRSELRVEPAALTGVETQYIAGFRDADSLRARIAKARDERSRRLGAAGVGEEARVEQADPAEETDRVIEAFDRIEGDPDVEPDPVEQDADFEDPDLPTNEDRLRASVDEFTSVSRRDFLKGATTVAAGFMFGGKLYAKPPGLMAILDKAKTAAIDLAEPVRWVAQHSADPAFRALAMKMAPLVRGVKLRVASAGQVKHGSVLVPDLIKWVEAHGVYFPDSATGEDQVWLATKSMIDDNVLVDGMNERTLLHEALHAAIDRYYGQLAIRIPNSQDLLVKEGHRRAAQSRPNVDADLLEIGLIWKEANDAFNRLGDAVTAGKRPKLSPTTANRIANALENPDEMLAWAIESPDVQNFLRSIPSKKKAEKSLWDRLLDLLARIFGSRAPLARTALDDLLDATNRLLDDVQDQAPVPAAPIEQVSAVGERRVRASRHSFEDPDTEKRFVDAAEGLGSGNNLITRVRLNLARVWDGMTRHWIELPNIPAYSGLQQKLRALEAAPQAAKEKTVRLLRDVVDGFSRDDLDVFTRKIILDDLMWETEQDHELPFGLTPKTLRAEREKVDSIIDASPRLRDAVRRRKLINKAVAADLVAAGVLEAERLKNPAYYRHVVLQYARAEALAAKGVGKKLRSPRWAKRLGSSLDINANYLEAEFDWLQKAFTDIPVAKTIQWIKESEHNILEDLRAEAKASNKAGIDSILSRQDDFGAMAREIDKDFRQRIAIGFKVVAEALDTVLVDYPDSLEASARAAAGGRGDPFPFLAWLLDSNEPGVNGAAMIMKAVSQRRIWHRQMLGRNYVDPQDADELLKKLAPEGYTTWSPDEGKLLFTVKTVPEHALDRMLERIDAAPGIKPDEIRAFLESTRQMLAMGGDRYKMILPVEVATTLNQLRREDIEGLLDTVAEVPLRAWKRWVLINPRRVLKYNLNNLSGDLDAVIAGNPRLLRHIGRAGVELAKVMRGTAKPSQRYEEAVERGVFDSGLSIQEIPDINALSAFEALTKPRSVRPDRLAAAGLGKVWRALQGTTQWRENVFRFAAYLDYVERLEGGEDAASIGYGASLPAMVDAVDDVKDRAALLARDLIGDYGAISHYGQGIRRKLIPFWSWMEINTKRYWRLTANAWGQGVGKGIATGGGLALAKGVRTTTWLGIRMAFLYGAITLWNAMLFGDEEDELTDEQKRQLHLILGRDSEGRVVTLRLQGALSDALSWFGFSDAAHAIEEYQLGRGAWWEALKAAPKATINKIGTSLSPLFTVPLEAATGQKLWPDLFATRFIRDRWRNLFSTFSLENEYDLVMERPSRGYGGSWTESVFYRRDPGEIAYGEARGIAYDWLKRVKGQDGGGFSSARSDALYDWRAARKFGDVEAEERALDKMEELGIDGKAFAQSIKRAHPLGPIAKKDRKAFLDSLTDEEYETFQRAEVWYNERYLAGAK